MAVRPTETEMAAMRTFAKNSRLCSEVQAMLPTGFAPFPPQHICQKFPNVFVQIDKLICLICNVHP